NQVDSSLTRQQGGAGLGLTISRKLVELMGGSLSLDSQLGRGSRFSFHLPVKVLDKTASRPPPIRIRAIILAEPGVRRDTLAETLRLRELEGIVTDSVGEVVRLASATSEPGNPALDLLIFDP